MLQLFWGTYAFPAGGAITRARTHLNLAKSGIAYSHTDSMECEAFIPVNGQADATQKLSQLETALAKPYQDLIFKDDSGKKTVLGLLNKPSISGVLITQGPDYLENRGPAYVTEMKVSFTAEAEYPLPNTFKMLLEFEERLEFSGGGPVRVYKNAMGNSLPQLQQPYNNTFYQLVQSGRAVGYRKDPLSLGIGKAIYPALVMHNPDLSMDSPQRRVSNYEKYPASWRWLMQSPKPIMAVPTLWKN